MKRGNFIKSVLALAAAPLAIGKGKAAESSQLKPFDKDPIQPIRSIEITKEREFEGLIPHVLKKDEICSTIGFLDQRDINKLMMHFETDKHFAEIMRLNLSKPTKRKFKF